MAGARKRTRFYFPSAMDEWSGATWHHAIRSFRHGQIRESLHASLVNSYLQEDEVYQGSIVGKSLITRTNSLPVEEI